VEIIEGKVPEELLVEEAGDFLCKPDCQCFVCQHLQELEQDLLAEETQLPVYFTHETPELMSVYDDISKSVGANSAGSAAEGEKLFA